MKSEEKRKVLERRRLQAGRLLRKGSAIPSYLYDAEDG